MKETSMPKVLHFRVAHYSEKVRWALDYKKVKHVRIAQIPGFHIPVARWHSDQNKLPILICADQVICGSNHILDALESLYPEPVLIPKDTAQRAKALQIQKYYDEKVAPVLRRLFWSTYLEEKEKCALMATAGFSDSTYHFFKGVYPLMRPLFYRNMQITPQSIAEARQLLPVFLDRLTAEIQPSNYLVGDQFCIADLTAAAVMTAIIRPTEFSYALPEPWPSELLELRQSISSHPGCLWVQNIYKLHRGSSLAIEK